MSLVATVGSWPVYFWRYQQVGKCFLIQDTYVPMRESSWYIQGRLSGPDGFARKARGHEQIGALSLGLNRISLCPMRYEKGGIPCFLISPQMSIRRSFACLRSCCASQSSKFICLRPSLTSSVITQDKGATPPYQGQ